MILILVWLKWRYHGKKLLNDKAKMNDWFWKNRTKYGNFKYIRNLIGVMVIISSVVYIGFSFIKYDICRFCIFLICMDK